MSFEETPVFSRRQAEEFTPELRGPDDVVRPVPRSYTIAPLTYRERIELRAAMARADAFFPSEERLIDAVKAALRALQPANMAQLLDWVAGYAELSRDPAERDLPAGRDAIARWQAVLAVVGDQPEVAPLAVQQERATALMPFFAAQHALRGWQGERLPPFRRVRGVVPDELLELLPERELVAVGWRAWGLAHLGPDAEKNSEPPSPSPGTPPTTPAA